MTGSQGVWLLTGLCGVMACGGPSSSSFFESGSSDTTASSSTSASTGNGNGNGSGGSSGSGGGASTGQVSSTSAGGGEQTSTTSASGSGGSSTGSGGSVGGNGGNGGTGGSDACTLTCERERAADGSELCRCVTPDTECDVDTDCGLASNEGVCCGGCQEAYPKQLIESEACLVPPGGASRGCESPDCSNVLCPAIACLEAKYAACEENRCVTKYECPDGMIDDHGSCVPPCESNGDCTIATYHGGCCGSCPGAYHRQTVEQQACLVEQGEESPDNCQPDPKECQLVACPQVLCVAPGTAACGMDGRCVTRPGVEF